MLTFRKRAVCKRYAYMSRVYCKKMQARANYKRPLEFYISKHTTREDYPFMFPEAKPLTDSN